LLPKRGEAPKAIKEERAKSLPAPAQIEEKKTPLPRRSVPRKTEAPRGVRKSEERLKTKAEPKPIANKKEGAS
jgi:hypothetical protein